MENNLSNYKKITLEILKYFDQICRKNDIKYSLYYGTLLGAIRHGGYIPWDDDIDVVMTYKEYNKLKSVVSANKNDRYEFLFPEDNSMIVNMCKLYDRNTTMKEKFMKHNSSLFIDIFIYYDFNPQKMNSKIIKKIKLFNKMLMFKNDLYSIKEFNMKYKLIAFASKFISKKSLISYIRKFQKTDYVDNVIDSSFFEKSILDVNYINSYIECEFEDLNAMIFKDFDIVLRKLYGDYMKLPPENERVLQHISTYDLNSPYYKK